MSNTLSVFGSPGTPVDSWPLTCHADARSPIGRAHAAALAWELDVIGAPCEGIERLPVPRAWQGTNGTRQLDARDVREWIRTQGAPVCQLPHGEDTHVLGVGGFRRASDCIDDPCAHDAAVTAQRARMAAWEPPMRWGPLGSPTNP